MGGEALPSEHDQPTFEQKVLVFSPQKFGTYVLAHPLAEGGAGYLFLALTHTGNPCVIKRLYPESLEDETARQRFVREGLLSLRLQHPNVVQTLDCGEQNGEPYLAMEYLEGHDLRWCFDSATSEQDALPFAAGAYVAHQALAGLAYLHRFEDRALVHRDVTPSNLFVTGTGEVKLLDFGIVRDRGARNLTRPATALGKLPYMAPEQLLARDVDARADLYALSACLWETLARRRLGSALHTSAALSDLSPRERLLSAEVPDPAQFQPEVPAPLARIALRGLSRPLSNRYQSADEMAADLVPFVALGRAQLAEYVAARYPAPAAEKARHAALQRARRLLPRAASTSVVSWPAPAAAAVEPPRRRRGRRVAPVGLVLAGLGAGAVWFARAVPESSVPPSAPGGASAANGQDTNRAEGNGPAMRDEPARVVEEVVEPYRSQPSTPAPPASSPSSQRPSVRARPPARPDVGQPPPEMPRTERESALPGGSQEAQVPIEEAKRAFASGDYARAAEVASRAVAAGVPAEALWGAALFKLQRYAEAERAFARALARTPADASLQRQVAAARAKARATSKP